MTFLVLIMGLLILRFHGHAQSVQKDSWFRGWTRSVENWSRLRHDSAQALLIILVPVALLALLLWLVRDLSLVRFTISLIVLLYSFGRGDLGAQLDDYCDAAKRGDTQAAYHELTPINRFDSGATDWLELQQELAAGLPYRLFEREFAVVFWFAVLGPAGALLYRLAWLRAAQLMESSQPTPGRLDVWSGSRLLALLEWLPARLLIPTLAIVGNFTPVMQLAGRLCLGSYPAATLLAILVQTASGWRARDLDFDSERDVIAGIQALMRRALVLWVLIVAVWVLLA